MTENAQRSAYAPDLMMSVIRQSPDNFRVLRLRAPERIFERNRLPFSRRRLVVFYGGFLHWITHLS
ncbi:hypothetical protein LH739_000374 [Salmonella enterica]|nr:hypothetical protein [Salmonella enterica]